MKIKNIFKPLIACLLLGVMGTSCEDNENWRIITDIQPGTYVEGSATAYSSVAPSSALAKANLDPADEDNQFNVQSIYTWLKADGEFFITKVNAEGTPTKYGKGEAVAASDLNTFTLGAETTPFTVAEDGLYNLVLNNADNQLSIVPVKFGFIGDATPGGWNSETLFTEINFNETISEVTFSSKDVYLDNKSMKFRYGNNWGLEVPYGDAKVKFHSNIGKEGDGGNITSAPSTCKPGGENFQVAEKGTYEVQVRFNLRSGTFSASANLTSKDETSAELPTNMFITGSSYGAGWDWNTGYQMIPVHSHEGMFWAVQYYSAGDQIKLNSEMNWTDAFGADTEDGQEYGEVTIGDKNLTFKNDGYYLILVTASLSDDKQSVVRELKLIQPEVYLINETAPNPDWGVHQENKFTLENDMYVSPVLKDGNLRMFVNLGDGVDPWQSEFNIFEDAIQFRGVGGDQAAVPVTAGQKVTLNFKNDTGTIK